MTPKGIPERITNNGPYRELLMIHALHDGTFWRGVYRRVNPANSVIERLFERIGAGYIYELEEITRDER
jgi:hypothetical protein